MQDLLKERNATIVATKKSWLVLVSTDAYFTFVLFGDSLLPIVDTYLRNLYDISIKYSVDNLVQEEIF